jgi:hypothetical protein
MTIKKTHDKSIKKLPEETNDLIECFIIMPIADRDGYDKGHFTRVYDDIIKPACKMAGMKPIRADEVKQTNLIHLDILNKTVQSPMAICDISSHNANVMFELGIRQAFDMPVTLIQEQGTGSIFDINGLRYTEYKNEMKYRDVIQAQNSIAKALMETYSSSQSNNGDINSLIKLLALNNAAKLPLDEKGPSDNWMANQMLQLQGMISSIGSQLNSNNLNTELKSKNEFEKFTKTKSKQSVYLTNIEIERILNNIISDISYIENRDSPSNELKYEKYKAYYDTLSHLKDDLIPFDDNDLELMGKIDEAMNDIDSIQPF